MKNKELILSNFYIPNIEAKDLYQENFINPKMGYSLKKKIVKKLYVGTLPYSLESMRLQKMDSFKFEKSEAEGKSTKYFTNAIINVNFNKSFKEYLPNDVGYLRKTSRKGQVYISEYTGKTGKTIKTIREVRDSLYSGIVEKDGKIVKVKIDGVLYCRYKRSSSKSRVGSCLFIRTDLYTDMIKWSRIGLEFEENEMCDLASLMAYESLTLSHIEKTISIKPHQILIIADKECKFDSRASITKYDENGEIVTFDDDIEINNMIWDGQSLLDENVFILNTEEEEPVKGMMLLRQRWFKSCAFNTRIQDYFKYRFGDDYETQILPDLFGNDRKARDIRLIITPSSLKFLKVAYKTIDDETIIKRIGTQMDNETTDEYQERISFEKQKYCYLYWLNCLNDEDYQFGVCKSETESFYGIYQQLAYQMINTLNLDLDEIIELLQPEIQYIEQLKNDIGVFKLHIGNNSKNASRQFIEKLLKINSKTQYTQLFKDFRKSTIDNYIKNLKHGKIKVLGADYCTLIGNPVEMLYVATGDNVTKSIHTGKQMYCSKFQDGKWLAGFRNPHITMGNVLRVQNVWYDEFKWFNLTDNIVISNAWDIDTMDRLQGNDYDSDNLLLIDNELIVSKALECEEFLTPINKIKATGDARKPYNAAYMSEVDDTLSQSKKDIGSVINFSQVLNSYYWDLSHKGYDQNLLKIIYDKASQLSSISQICIDRAKKPYGNINIMYILKQLKEIKFDDKNIIRKGDITVYNVPGEEEFQKFKELESKKKIYSKFAKRSSFKEHAKECLKEINKSILSLCEDTKEKLVRPQFLEIVGEGSNYKFEHFDCPMDYLIDVLSNKKYVYDEETQKYGFVRHKYIKDIVDRTTAVSVDSIMEDIDSEKKNTHHMQDIKKIMLDTETAIKNMYKDKKRDKNDDFDTRADIVNDGIEKLEEININEFTICGVYTKIYGSSKQKDKDYKRNKTTILSMLDKAHPDIMEKCFKLLEDNKSSQLVEHCNGDIIIWGKKHKRIA